MNETLCKEHDALRSTVAVIRALKQNPNTSPETSVNELKASLSDHFKKEEIHYRTMDQETNSTADRALIHQLRNDHAAMTFGMESLLIRLRKNGSTEDWWAHFEKLMTVFEPHMELEELKVFPLLETGA